MKPRYIFIIAAVSVVLSMAVLFGIVSTQGGRVGEAQAAPTVANAALARGHAPTIGNPDAKVHIVEFLDPACETCREFYPFVKKLMAANPDRIRLSIRHVTFHKGSDSIVRMLEAARKQGKYWEALEALLASQPNWAIQHTSRPELALPKLAAIGLNLDRSEGGHGSAGCGEEHDPGRRGCQGAEGQTDAGVLRQRQVDAQLRIRPAAEAGVRRRGGGLPVSGDVAHAGTTTGVTVSTIGLRDSTRQLATVLAVGSGLALATGLFVQHGLGYAPCSLCVLQRLAFIVVLIVTLPLAMFRLPRTATMVLVGLALVATLLGLGVASYQVWMQAYPAEVGRCGSGLEAYFDDSPFEDPRELGARSGRRLREASDLPGTGHPAAARAPRVRGDGRRGIADELVFPSQGNPSMTVCSNPRSHGNAPRQNEGGTK